MENYKEKLIELFKKSCMDLTIPRGDATITINVRSEAKRQIVDVGYPKQMGSFYRDDWHINDNEYYVGFNYSELPALGLGAFSAKYELKYGRMIPLISYLFINNYRNRKKYKAEADALTANDPTLYDLFMDTLDKTISFRGRKYFIIHGSLFAIITEEEFQELIQLYRKQVYEYDELKLNERLSK